MSSMGSLGVKVERPVSPICKTYEQCQQKNAPWVGCFGILGPCLPENHGSVENHGFCGF